MKRRTSVAILVVLVAGLAWGEEKKPGLGQLDFMIGEWVGTSRGEPGEGTMERVCTRVLNDRFIECRTKVTYLPQEKNRKGEVHVDIAWYSFDKRAGKLRLRQFHGEGFVNTYAEAAALVFVADDIENIPQGWRARETYERVSADAWSERFELAAPGKDFTLYSATSLRRAGSE